MDGDIDIDGNGDVDEEHGDASHGTEEEQGNASHGTQQRHQSSHRIVVQDFS